MIDEQHLTAFETAKSRSTAQLLFKAARLVDERALARIREQTGMTIRPAHTKLFPHIDLEGTRLTTLARRVGISKQAAGQLVDNLVEMGAVERVPDPSDGRAKLVRFTVHDGELSLLPGLRMLGELERELAEAIGEERWGALHDALVALLQVLDAPGSSVDAPRATD